MHWCILDFITDYAYEICNTIQNYVFYNTSYLDQDTQIIASTSFLLKCCLPT